MRATRRLSLCGLLLALAAAFACGDGGSPQPVDTAAPAAEQWFVDRARASGLDVVHFNGAAGSFYYPEILPPGVALFDMDNDGDLDVYVAQGQMLGPSPDPSRALIAPRDPDRLTVFGAVQTYLKPDELAVNRYTSMTIGIAYRR